MKHLRIILVITLLAGCERHYSFGVDDYAVKLARVLDQELATKDSMAVEPFPRTRDIRIVFASEGLGLLEFLSIGDCELQNLVAERNSSLGRLALPSQQLVYELGVLRTGEDCVESIAGEEPELVQKLASAIATKKKELPHRIWAATLGGREFKSYWSLAEVRELDAVVADAEITFALTGLSADIDRWLRGDYEVDSGRLEGQLDVIRQGRGGSQLLLWNQLRRDLRRSTRLLSDRLAEKPLCYPGMKTATADVFRNVVMTEFVARIQKAVARLNRSSLDQMNLVRRIESSLGAVHQPIYAVWREQREHLLDDSMQAFSDHTGALEPLMRQCGFLPADTTDR